MSGNLIKSNIFCVFFFCKLRNGKIQAYGGWFEFLPLEKMFFSLAEIRSGVCSGEGREERRNGENEEKCYKKTEKNDNGIKCRKIQERKGGRWDPKIHIVFY